MCIQLIKVSQNNMKQKLAALGGKNFQNHSIKFWHSLFSNNTRTIPPPKIIGIDLNNMISHHDIMGSYKNTISNNYRNASYPKVDLHLYNRHILSHKLILDKF